MGEVCVGCGVGRGRRFIAGERREQEAGNGGGG